MCQICQKEGHLKMACPEETLPPLEPLSPLTPYYDAVLTQALWRVPCKLCFSMITVNILICMILTARHFNANSKFLLKVHNYSVRHKKKRYQNGSDPINKSALLCSIDLSFSLSYLMHIIFSF